MSDPIVAPADQPAAITTATAKPSAMWWITTVAGIAIPIMLALGPILPAPWNALFLQLASALGGALGVTHTGKILLA
jgi:hypothetical protein